MLKTHFLLAIRHFWKNKTISLINLLGLSMGICSFVLILQYVAFEWSFNSMYNRADRVFRVVVENPKKSSFFVAPGYAPMLQGQFPEIDRYTRILPNIGNGVVQVEPSNSYFQENTTAFVDSAFLDLFNCTMIEGGQGFSKPKQVLLSASQAQKFFGDSSALGQTLRLDNQFGATSYTVAGIFDDFPTNTDYKYDILLSIHTLASPENRKGSDWADPNGTSSGFGFVFFELKNPDRASEIASSITQLIQTFSDNDKLAIHLQPLSEIHLGKNLRDTLPQYGNRILVVFLFCIAFLILGIAFVNYVNLSTAQGMERAKEVGIRKVSGARRSQLAYQHLLETLILTSLAAFIAFAFIPIIQPSFNRLVGQPLNLALLAKSWYLGLGSTILTLGTILSGFYVAVVLTRLAPIQTLKGTLMHSSKGNLLQKGLVITQFTIAIALIAGTLVLFLQLRYLHQQDLGIQTQQRITINGPSVKEKDFEQRQQIFRDKLEQIPFVQSFCSSGGIPGKGYNFSSGNITRPNGNPEDKKISYGMLLVDENYQETFEITQISGRNFTAEEAQKGFDVGRVMLNETAARMLHFEKPDQAVGQPLKWGDSSWEVVGVLKDYNHASLHTPVGPIVFIPNRNSKYFTLKMNTNDFSARKLRLSQLYAEAFPGNPFEYEFLDESYAKLYESEQRLGKLFTTASLLAIFISVLGMMGLASFIVRQKKKEVGIRKVLGASASSIIQLLSSGFLKLIFLSFLIATPLAWYVTDTWLQNFAYRINMPVWIFFLAGIGTAILALLMVSFQSLRTATANPIEALRTE
ncbi:MAG: ABC transporter permease [Bacteroidota bacterium]